MVSSGAGSASLSSSAELEARASGEARPATKPYPSRSRTRSRSRDRASSGSRSPPAGGHRRGVGGRRGWDGVARADATGLPVTRTVDGGLPHAPSRAAYETWEDERVAAATRRADAVEGIIAAVEGEVRSAHAARHAALAARRKRRRDATRSGEPLPDDFDSGEGDDEELGVPRTMPRVTRGTAALRDTVLGDTVTEEDVDAQLEADTNHLVWVPVPPPDDVRTQAALGPPPAGRDACFACASGGPSQNAVQVAALARMWAEAWPYCSPEACAQQVARAYEDLRASANRLLRVKNLGLPSGAPREAPLGPWSAASVHEHFTAHVHDPETFVAQAIREHATIRRALYAEGVFNRNARDAAAVRISDRRLGMYLKVTESLRRLYACAPRAMVGYSAARSGGLADRGVAPVNPAKTLSGYGTRTRSTLDHYFDDGGAAADGGGGG